MDVLYIWPANADRRPLFQTLHMTKDLSFVNKASEMCQKIDKMIELNLKHVE